MKFLKFSQTLRLRHGIYARKSIDLAKILAVVSVVVVVLSSVTWLVRDAMELNAKFAPAEGSLIVNINTASQDELISVPGIGPTRAAQIIAGRPYATVDELEKIAGIGGKTLESLRPFVTVEGDTRKFQ